MNGNDFRQRYRRLIALIEYQPTRDAFQIELAALKGEIDAIEGRSLREKYQREVEKLVTRQLTFERGLQPRC